MTYTSVARPPYALPRARLFIEDFKKRFDKYPQPYAAEAYDATAIAIWAIEDVARTGKVARESVAAAVRKTKIVGVTGEIAFDAKGDRRMVPYFVLSVASDNSDRWSDNKIIQQFMIPTP